MAFPYSSLLLQSQKDNPENLSVQSLFSSVFPTMISGISTSADREDDGLREKKVAFTSDTTPLADDSDGEEEVKAGKDEVTKQTFGRTSDGTGMWRLMIDKYAIAVYT